MDVREKVLELIDDALQRKEGTARVVGKRYVNTISNHLIENGVTVQEWISASEPPEEKGCYLVSVKHWLDGKPVTREAFWNGADWLSCYWGKGDRVELTPRVTHWMPLPPPQKGE